MASAPNSQGAPAPDEKPLSRTEDPLVWIDLEMTGLQENDQIIEVACILTSANLQPLPHDPDPFHAVIHCPPARLAQMDPWCVRTHGQSGLSSACIQSTTSPTAAADGLREYIVSNLSLPARAGPGSAAFGRPLLAGSSVHADAAAMRRSPDFRTVLDLLHYRILDVSSIKEAARRWCGANVLRRVPRKGAAHRALDDIRESIEEAKYYRDAVFGPARGPQGGDGGEA